MQGDHADAIHGFGSEAFGEFLAAEYVRWYGVA